MSGARAVATLALLGALCCPAVAAQDLEPRAYANAPVGLNFLIGGYGYSTGAALFDSSQPLDNASVDAHTSVVACARSFGAWGRSAKLDITLPYVELSGSADLNGVPAERNVSGWADPRFRVSLNLYGAPALSSREFGAYRQDLIVGASLLVWAPLGRYDAGKLLNIGANRWVVRPEIGLSKAAGRWTFELIGAVSWYQDNDEFLGTHTREQAPIYSVQGGVILSLRRDVWLALFGTYYTGGRTSVDGVRNTDLQQNSRVGLTLSLPVNRRNSVKLSAATGVTTRTGTDFDGIAAAWQYRWGAGL